MSFDPQSTIWLCNVPFDNTYKNVVYFENITQQRNYFTGKAVKTYENYLIVRETLPNGGMRSSIKVGENIGVLRALLANYMYWINPNHSNKHFYAFITDFIYVNENTTKIVFETDVYQTWRFEATLLPSFVVREHSYDDQIGWNLTPEKFDVQDYEYIKVDDGDAFGVLGTWGYLIGSSAGRSSDELSNAYRGQMMSGIYQGVKFFFTEELNTVNTIIDDIESNKSDSVLFITVIPKFCLGNAVMTDGGYVQGTTAAAQRTFNVNITDNSFDSFVPKNKKLFTSPYFKLMVTNHNGTQAEYALEDFKDRQPSFIMRGDISASPSVVLIPQNYRKSDANWDFGLMLSAFPQCSFNHDTFKLWLAKNAYTLKTNAVTNATSIATGAAMMMNPATAFVGGTIAASGAAGIMATIGNVYSQSKEPNKANMGSGNTNLLTAIGQNRFSFYVQKIKQHHAKIIDDFFTMYGYQVNELKTPNTNVRRWFTYTQTIDANITGGIPNDDMAKLKSIYNNGVTQWARDAVIGDYSVDNYCISEGGNG